MFDKKTKIDELMKEINANNIEKSLQIINENENELKNEIDFLHSKALLCTKVGEYNTAINILKQALEKEPDNKDTWCNLGYTYNLMNEINNIEDRQNIIIKKYPLRIKHEKAKGLPIRREIVESLIETDSPLVSIIVLAYNKLEYTKMCIESIYKYTNNIEYELILVDNGSNDGTTEYFKGLKECRVIRLENNQGAVGGFNEGFKAARGKFIAGVCNDFIFTTNWLNNLVKCINSDASIGYVAPGSNYISNFQQINLQFTSTEEMQNEANRYNVSDSSKWEERIRLMPTVFMVKKEVLEIVGYYDPIFYYGEFGDDDISFRIRRAGYKLIYCGDTFVYHFGHITVGTDQIENQSLEISRKEFRNKYNGIDTWIDITYDFNLLSNIEPEEFKREECMILGIRPKCGNILLMAKNKLIQNGLKDIKLYAYEEDGKYYEDLKTISEEVWISNIEDISKKMYKNQFDYIIIDEPINRFANLECFIRNLKMILKDTGKILVSLCNDYDVYEMTNIMKCKKKVNQSIEYKINVETFNEICTIVGLNVEKIIRENYQLNDEEMLEINRICNKITMEEELEASIFEKLICARYLITLTK